MTRRFRTLIIAMSFSLGACASAPVMVPARCPKPPAPPPQVMQPVSPESYQERLSQILQGMPTGTAKPHLNANGGR